MRCPYLDSNYVCQLSKKDMRYEYNHRDTYCTGVNQKIDGLKPYLNCPYYG